MPGYNIQSLFRVLPQHTVARRCAKSLELPQNGFLRGNQVSLLTSSTAPLSPSRRKAPEERVADTGVRPRTAMGVIPRQRSRSQAAHCRPRLTPKPSANIQGPRCQSSRGTSNHRPGTVCFMYQETCSTRQPWSRRPTETRGSVRKSRQWRPAGRSRSTRSPNRTLFRKLERAGLKPAPTVLLRIVPIPKAPAYAPYSACLPPRGTTVLTRVLVPIVVVLEPYDVVLAQIRTRLHLDDFQRDVPRVFQPVFGTLGHVC